MKTLSEVQAVEVAIKLLQKHYNQAHQKMIEMGQITPFTKAEIAKELADCYEWGCGNTDLILMSDVFILLKNRAIVASELLKNGIVILKEIGLGLDFLLTACAFDDFDDFYENCDDDSYTDYQNFRAWFLSELGAVVQNNHLYGVVALAEVA